MGDSETGTLITTTKNTEAVNKRSSVQQHKTPASLYQDAIAKYEHDLLLEKLNELFINLVNHSSKHGVLPEIVNIDRQEKNENAIELITNITGIASLFFKKFDQQKKSIESHNMQDDYSRCADKQVSEISNLTSRNSVLNRQITVLKQTTQNAHTNRNDKK